MTDGKRWDVPVLVQGRHRHVELRVTAGRVVMVAPVATGMVIPRASIQPFCAALQAADSAGDERAVTVPDWRMSSVVYGFDLTQLATVGPRAVPTVPLVTGLLETAADDLQFAMRIGEGGEPVILPLEAANLHITHMRELLIRRLRDAGARLGEDES
jgi:hypothetical protein